MSERSTFRELIEAIEIRYVEALNAALAAYDTGSSDAYRWRGHAEAYRQVATLLREAASVKPVDMTSEGWRKANGVYQPDYLATLRRDASPEGSPR